MTRDAAIHRAEAYFDVRGPRRHFTHSKLMAWVGVDRAIAGVEQHGLAGPVEQWRGLRERICSDILRNGYDAERNTFVQYYGGQALDAALLMIFIVGFLPAHDPRVVGTVEAIQRELTVDGFVLRYSQTHAWMVLRAMRALSWPARSGLRTVSP